VSSSSSNNVVFIFANPIAGRGKGRSVAQRIARRLTAQGFHVRTFHRPAQDVEARELRTGSLRAHAAITVGGDGTLRSAAERLLQLATDEALKVPPFLVVPLGTANLMVRHLGIAWNDQTLEDEVAAAVVGRRTIEIDAAHANDRLFLLMAGVGLDATVVHELDRIRNGPIDITSYAMPALLALQKYQYPALRVEIDGRRVVNATPALAFVGNIPEYGTGFPILTRAKSNDGLLDVCVLPCRSPADLLRLALSVTTGDHVHQEGVVYAKGKSVRIDSPSEVPVQIDGEASGHTPLEIDLLPSKLRFIVP
jgi:diacylglycerol kinase (ATP)